MNPCLSLCLEGEWAVPDSPETGFLLYSPLPDIIITDMTGLNSTQKFSLIDSKYIMRQTHKSTVTNIARFQVSAEMWLRLSLFFDVMRRTLVVGH